MNFEDYMEDAEHLSCGGQQEHLLELLIWRDNIPCCPFTRLQLTGTFSPGMFWGGRPYSVRVTDAWRAFRAQLEKLRPLARDSELFEQAMNYVNERC